MRVLITSKALLLFGEKLFWPFNLSAYYPLSATYKESIPALIVGFILVYGVVLAALFIALKKQNKIVFFGLSFFIIHIVLFIIPAGVPVLTADRYTYVPFLGLFAILAYGLNLLISRYKQLKFPVLALLLGFTILFGYRTYSQSKTWNDSITLWNHVINTTGETSFPLMKRGIAYRNLGELDKALDDFNASIKLENPYPDIYENRGYIYLLREDYNNALINFETAVNMDSESAYAWRNLGLCNFNLGNLETALSNINRSLELEPENAYAYKTRGRIYMGLDQVDNGCPDLKMAVKLGLSEINEKEALELIEIHCKTD
jgi:tetratricopeptide (TPR) repeat protein